MTESGLVLPVPVLHQLSGLSQKQGWSVTPLAKLDAPSCLASQPTLPK